MNRPSFTLVELLIVIFLVAVLLFLLLTGVQHVRAVADKAHCASRMKDIGMALLSHHDVHGAFPCQANVQMASWMFQILPFVGHGHLHRQGMDWRNDEWSKTWMTVIPAFLCPSDGRENSGGVYWFQDESVGYSMTNYLGVAGSDSSLLKTGVWNGMIGDPDHATRIADVADGLSCTLMVGERPPGPDLFWGWPFYRVFDNSLWAVVDKSVTVYLSTDGLNKPGLPVGDPCPDKSSYGPGSLDNYCSVLHFWSQHRAGANWLLGDGSVRFLKYDAKCIVAMATVAGGELVQFPD